jgi:hypothetical protein
MYVGTSAVKVGDDAITQWYLGDTDSKELYLRPFKNT